MIFKIALRNIFRNKRRTLLTALTMFGGFVLSSFAISSSDGSYSFILNAFTKNRLGHIQLHKEDFLESPSLFKYIEDYILIGAKISGVEGVLSYAPRVYAAGLASLGEVTTGVRIAGIDPVLENQATAFDKKIIKGRGFSAAGEHTVVLGKGAAEILNAEIGSQIIIISQAADGSMANELYTLSGIVETLDYAADRTYFFLHIIDAQALLSIENKAHEIAVIINNIDTVKQTADKIRGILSDSTLKVETWQEFAKTFYYAMRLDEKGMWITILIIMLIVAVGALNTILMATLERRREYGLLKAMGAKPALIVELIIIESLTIAFLSIIAGIVVSLGVNYYFSIHGIAIPKPMRYGGVVFDAMYTSLNARSFYVPAFTIIISAFIVGLIPGIHAARTDPAKAMRAH